MAKEMYVGVDSSGGKARRIANAYVGVENKARKIVKGYVGVNETFTPIEYIESTGTQYIDSGVTSGQVNKIIAEFYNTFGLLYDNRTYGSCCVGARVSASDSYFAYNSGVDAEMLGNGISYISFQRGIGTEKITLDYSKSSYSVIWGSDTHSGNLSASITTPLNIYVFALNNNGTASCGTYKIMKMQFYDSNDELIRDFIPVLDENNVACLYDKVENKPYYNLGTGTFTPGSTTGEPVITIGRARQFYDSVEHYIQGTGTQYINSGFTATPNTTTIIDFKMDNVVANSGICGNISYDNTNLNYSLYVNTVLRFAVAYGDGESYWQSLGVPADTNRHTISFDGYGRKVLVDGYQRLDLSDNTATKNSLTGIYLFRSHNNGLPMKLYGAKIYNNGILVRDFIPALDSNNVACLYEKVSGTYYYNAGTGNFIYG